MRTGIHDSRDSSPPENRPKSAGGAGNPLRAVIFFAILLTLTLRALTLQVQAEEVQPQGVVVLSDDGGWCWFQDPRALVQDGKLVVGAVASGRFEPERKGDIEALVHDLQSGRTTRVELFDKLEADDHATPAFLVRPDGRYLTLFSKHSTSDGFHYRISAPGDPTRWGALRTYLPSPSTSLCYSNIFLLAGEQNRIYNFFAGWMTVTSPPSPIRITWGKVGMRGTFSLPQRQECGTGPTFVTRATPVTLST